jgi:hypothetical protein
LSCTTLQRKQRGEAQRLSNRPLRGRQSLQRYTQQPQAAGGALDSTAPHCAALLCITLHSNALRCTHPHKLCQALHQQGAPAG